MTDGTPQQLTALWSDPTRAPGSTAPRAVLENERVVVVRLVEAGPPFQGVASARVPCAHRVFLATSGEAQPTLPPAVDWSRFPLASPNVGPTPG